MPNGELHSGKTHGKTSVKLYHFNELSAKAKEKAMPYHKSSKPKAKSKPNKPKKKPMKRGY